MSEESFNIESVLYSLFMKNKIFSSEAHFQLELAWTIREMEPGFDISLEYVPYECDGSMHVDVALFEKGDDHPSIFIELKYTTKRIDPSLECGIILKNQGAQDLRRYDFIKDIKRLERLTEAYHGSTGYAVFLTNDPTIWKKSARPNTCDADFRIHERKVLTGELRWNANTAAGTMKGREQPLVLEGRYTMHWEDYMPHGVLFRYSYAEVHQQIGV